MPENEGTQLRSGSPRRAGTSREIAHIQIHSRLAKLPAVLNGRWFRAHYPRRCLCRDTPFMLTITALLLSAFLFGGMMLYSFGFAAFLFSQLPAPEAGSILRKAFPVFYLWCIAVAGLTSVVLAFVDSTSALLMVAVAITTVPARQTLMPAINAATDANNKRRFNFLHGASVLLGLAQIAAVGYVLTRIGT